MYHRAAGCGHGDGICAGWGSGTAAASAIALQPASAGERTHGQNCQHDNSTVPADFTWQNFSLKHN